MRVELIAPAELGERELKSWSDWQAADDRLVDPFLSASFALLAGRARPDSRVAVVGDGGSTMGFWPLSISRSRAAGPVIPGYTGLQGMVHAPGLEWDWSELVTGARLSGWSFDHLVGYQSRHLRGSFSVGSSPMVDLSEGWDCYEQWLRTYHKKILQRDRQWMRAAVRDFEVTFTARDRGADALAALLQLKSAQCRRNGWVDVFGLRWTRQLVEEAANTTGEDLSGTLSTLRFDGRVVSVALYLDSAPVRCVWFSAFDPDYKQYRPGMLLTLRLLQETASSGFSIFSLGKGSEEYKRRLTQTEAPLASGRVRGAGAIGAAFGISRTPVQLAERLFARAPAAEETVRRAVQRGRKVYYSRAGS